MKTVQLRQIFRMSLSLSLPYKNYVYVLQVFHAVVLLNVKYEKQMKFSFENMHFKSNRDCENIRKIIYFSQHCPALLLENMKGISGKKNFTK